MSAIELFAGPEWERVGLALLHFVWQGAAVAGGVAGVGMLLRRGRRRYALYLMGLMVMAACPVVTYCLLSHAGQSLATDLTPVAHEKLSGGVVVNQPMVLKPEKLPPLDTDPLAGGFWKRGEKCLRASMPWWVAMWVAGVSVLSIRLLMGVLGLRRWRREREQLPLAVGGRVTELAERMGLGRFQAVFGSRRVKQAVAVGYWRPMVLVPIACLSAMPVEMLEAVIAHELAHIRRWDLWVNLLQRVMETVLFYHPAVWSLSGKVRAEREICCDEMAVAVTGRRVEYASALEMAAREQWGGQMLAAALGGQRKVLLGRVRHVLGLPAERMPWSWPAGLGGLMVVMMVGVAATMLRAGEKQQSAPAATTLPLASGKVLHMLDLVVGPESMTFEGQEATWQEVAEALEGLLEPKKTVLEVAVASDDVPVGRYRDAMGKAFGLVQKYGLAYISDVGVKPLRAKGADVPDNRPEGNAADGRAKLVGPKGEVVEADQIIINPQKGQIQALGNAKIELRGDVPPRDMEKERANRIKCASNLRRIGQGMMLYADDHKGEFPPDLGMLVTVATLNAEAFVCPSAWPQVPGEVRVAKPQTAAKWINTHTDYVYLAPKMNANKDPADAILAYEKLKDHEGDGVNVLFNDGHVEWVGHNAAVRMIEDLGAGQNPPKLDPTNPRVDAKPSSAP